MLKSCAIMSLMPWHSCKRPSSPTNASSVRAPMQSCLTLILERIPSSHRLQLPSAECALDSAFRLNVSSKPSGWSKRIQHVLVLAPSPPNNSMYSILHLITYNRISAHIFKRRVTSTEQPPVADVVADGSTWSNSATLTKSTDTLPSISQNSTSSTTSLKSKSESNISTREPKFLTSPPISKSWKKSRLNTSL